MEWLGEIPSHWDLTIGMNVFRENKRDNKGMKEKTVLSLSYGQIIIKPEEKLVGLVPESFETYQIVEPNDIIIRCTDLQNDKTSLRTGLAKDKGIITSAYLNLKVINNHSAKFLHYYLHTLDITKVLYKFGSGLRQNLSFLDFKRLPIIDIPLSEQQKIAQFLDDKTAKIDQAVDLAEKQIALLKEHKQILIQNAVTRGLNPDVPLKDFGVEWIGKVPEHWEVKKIKAFAKINNGLDYKAVIAEEGYPVYGSGGQFAYANTYLYDGEAVLLGRKGTIDKPLYINDKFWTVDTMFYSVCNNKVSTKFFYYCCCSIIPFQYYSTSTALPSMTQSDILNHKVTFPSLKEQYQIADYLDIQTAKIDQAIALKTAHIEKLKEYKSVLINDVVTGKVRV
ncbi:TPA: restriction endonuclease subunit S [Neisseria subflava]